METFWEVAVLEGDVFDICKGILNFIPGGVVVDVVSETSLVRTIEDDKIHGILTHSTPRAYTQGATREVMDY